MSKYIDAECLRKEVKRLEKAAHKSALGCADSETRKFHDGKEFAYQHIGSLIDSLQQEQPSLPDLDEAAREIVIKMHPSLMDYCIILGDRVTRGQLVALVKAGAEWAMQQLKVE